MSPTPQVDRWLGDLRAYHRVSLDTNIVIYALEEIPPYHELAQHLLRLLELGFLGGVVSTIVEAEVLVKPLRERDQIALNKAELFFREFPHLTIRAFDHALVRRAALVRASSGLKLPDAIIVATALEEKCDALVGNDDEMAHGAIGIQYVRLGNYIS